MSEEYRSFKGKGYADERDKKRQQSIISSIDELKEKAKGREGEHNQERGEQQHQTAHSASCSQELAQAMTQIDQTDERTPSRVLCTDH
jgi:hypothetical protein